MVEATLEERARRFWRMSRTFHYAADRSTDRDAAFRLTNRGFRAAYAAVLCQARARGDLEGVATCRRQISRITHQLRGQGQRGSVDPSIDCLHAAQSRGNH